MISPEFGTYGNPLESIPLGDLDLIGHDTILIFKASIYSLAASLPFGSRDRLGERSFGIRNSVQFELLVGLVPVLVGKGGAGAGEGEEGDHGS